MEQAQQAPNKQNASFILRDIYALLYQIDIKMSVLEFHKADVETLKEEIKYVESLLPINETPLENVKYAEVLLEVENIKKEVDELYEKTMGTTELVLEPDVRKKLEKVEDQMRENNKEVTYKIHDIRTEGRKKDSLYDTLIPNGYEALIAGIIANILLTTYIPTKTNITETYSSKTGETTVSEERVTYFGAQNKQTINIYGQLVDDNREVIEYSLQGTSFADAILKAEELLKIYDDKHDIEENEENEETNPYYEIIYVSNKGSTFLPIILVSIGVAIAAAFLSDYNFKGPIIVRIIENLKAGFITKRDLKELITLAKEIQVKNQALANELYTMIINGEKFPDFDKLYERVQSLVNKPVEDAEKFVK